MKIIKTIIVVSLLFPISLAAAPQVISDSTDLDFSGDFVYAINFNGADTETVGDASFQSVDSSGGGAPLDVSVGGFNVDTIWGGATNLGFGEDNDSLESIMRTIIWSNGLNPGKLELKTIVGTSYRLQLLFSEDCCNNRNFGVDVEDGRYTGNVVGTELSGSIWKIADTQGYAMIWEFTAEDSVLDIKFSRKNEGNTDYHVSGLTLEKLPNGVAPSNSPSVEQSSNSESEKAASISFFVLMLFGIILFMFRKNVSRV